MKLNIQQLICFGLLNYVFTFPNDLFDELWQINESAPQASDNPIGSQPKIKIEPHEEKFDGGWQVESAQKGIVKIEHEPHYGAVNVKGTAKIKHEPHYEDVKVKLEQNDESKNDFIKVKVEEVGPSVEEHGQRVTTTSPKTEDGAQTSMAPKRQLPNVLDTNTKRSRQIRAKSKMPPNESSEEDNYSEETEESHDTFEESDYSESEDLMELNHKNNQQNSRKRICHTEEEKLEIVNKFLEMKQNIYNKGDNKKSHKDIDKEIADKFGVNIHTINQWKKQFGLSQRKPKNEHKHLKEKFVKKAELKRAGFKCSYQNELDKTDANGLGLSDSTIYAWKCERGQTGTKYSDDEKIKILKKLMRMKSDYAGEDNKSCKEIDKEIAERFGVNVRTINRWKKKFSLSQKVVYEKEERKQLIEKFDQKKAELKRDGFKNSYPHEIDETVAKELGLSFTTIYAWKQKLGQTAEPQHNHNKQKELMKLYYEMKDKNPKLSDKDIAKMLNIGRVTLFRWKKQFKRQQMHPNSVDVGHSVEENAAGNVQEIDNSN